MKKFIMFVMLIAISTMANAITLVKTSNGSFVGNMVNETALVSSATYTIDMAQYDSNRAAAVVSYSSGTMTAGTPGFYWQESNDDTTYFDVAVASVTLSTNTVGVNVSTWDFSNVNYRYLRLNFIGPATGGMVLKAVINVKK